MKSGCPYFVHISSFVGKGFLHFLSWKVRVHTSSFHTFSLLSLRLESGCPNFAIQTSPLSEDGRPHFVLKSGCPYFIYIWLSLVHEKWVSTFCPHFGLSIIKWVSKLRLSKLRLQTSSIFWLEGGCPYFVLHILF